MAAESFLKKVNLLVQMHAQGLLGGESMPEDALADVVPESELSNVLTLGMSLNYQRNSYKLWNSVVEALSRRKLPMDIYSTYCSGELYECTVMYCFAIELVCSPIAIQTSGNVLRTVSQHHLVRVTSLD